MSFDSWAMLVILVVMFGLLVWDRFPAWIVFVGTLTVTMTLRLAPEDQLLEGFSNVGVATVAVLFMVAAGMYSTGAITLIADRFIGLPSSLREAQLKVLTPVAVGSAVLNNTPLVAMMIPVIRDISQAARLSAARLYMPMGFASTLGGAMTVIGTSTNLIIAGLVFDAIADGQLGDMDPVSIFDPTWVGLPAAALGVLFLVFIGGHLLPSDSRRGRDGTDGKRMYRAEFRVAEGSPLVGRTVEDVGLAGAEGFALHSRERAETPATRSAERETAPDTRSEDANAEFLRPGDVLVFHTDRESLPGLWTKIGLVPVAATPGEETERHEEHLVEVVVAPSHPGIGRIASDIPPRNRPHFRSLIVAASRDGEPMKGRIGDTPMAAEDRAVLAVDGSFFYETRLDNDFLLTRRLGSHRVQRTSRATTATVITVAMVALAAFGVMSMFNAALLASMAMLMSGCLDLDRAWRSIDWKILVVLASAIGLESAITGSGLSQVIADTLTILGGDSPHLALAIVFLGATVMTNVITNAAAAAFMFPVAVSIASNFGVNFMPFVIALMLGASYTFINPAGYQINLMVQTPGKYSFFDFVKVGLPLTILVGVVVVVLAPLIHGF